MKVLVPVKRVVDYNVKIRVKADGSGVELANVKMSMNPFDEIAVEEAFASRKPARRRRIVAVSIGPQQASETIRRPCHGADRGILVKSDSTSKPLAVAKILKGIVDAEKPSWSSSQAGDRRDCKIKPSDAGSAARLAAGTFASKVVIEGDSVLVYAEVDGGLQTVKPKGAGDRHPDLRLNEPRYARCPIS